MIKRISITERYKVEFAAQAMNVFNHAQYIGGFIDKVDQVSSSAIDGSVRSYLIPNDPNFDKPSNVFSSNPRTMQLSLKFMF